MELCYQVDSEWLTHGYYYRRVIRFGSLFDALAYASNLPGWYRIFKCELLCPNLAYPVSLVARSANFQEVSHGC